MISWQLARLQFDKQGYYFSVTKLNQQLTPGCKAVNLKRKLFQNRYRLICVVHLEATLIQSHTPLWYINPTRGGRLIADKSVRGYSFTCRHKLTQFSFAFSWNGQYGELIRYCNAVWLVSHLPPWPKQQLIVSLLAKKWATIGSLSLQLKSERRL